MTAFKLKVQGVECVKRLGHGFGEGRLLAGLVISGLVVQYVFCRRAAEGETHWSFAMDATDASFAKFMTAAVDLPSRGVSFWAPPMERASLDAPASYFRFVS